MFQESTPWSQWYVSASWLRPYGGALMAGRYEYAKRQLKKIRSQFHREHRTPYAGEYTVKIYWGPGLVRYAFDIPIGQESRKTFPWPIPDCPPGHRILFAVTPNVKQEEEGCLCLSTRCTDDVRCHPDNVAVFDRLPDRRGTDRIILYGADGRVEKVLKIKSEDSGPRRRIAMLMVPEEDV